MNVNNHDVAGLYGRLNRFAEELNKSVSSSTSRVNSFDQARLASYLNAIDIFHDWVIGQPQLDLPETHPRTIELPAPPALGQVENESINDVIRMLVLCRDELVNSQSARDGSGLNKFDSARLRAVTAKIQKFLDDYIAEVTPLDLPESSPGQESSGAGRTGI